MASRYYLQGMDAFGTSQKCPAGTVAVISGTATQGTNIYCTPDANAEKADKLSVFPCSSGIPVVTKDAFGQPLLKCFSQSQYDALLAKIQTSEIIAQQVQANISAEEAYRASLTPAQRAEYDRNKREQAALMAQAEGQSETLVTQQANAWMYASGQDAYNYAEDLFNKQRAEALNKINATVQASQAFNTAQVKQATLKTASLMVDAAAREVASLESGTPARQIAFMKLKAAQWILFDELTAQGMNTNDIKRQMLETDFAQNSNLAMTIKDADRYELYKALNEAALKNTTPLSQTPEVKQIIQQAAATQTSETQSVTAPAKVIKPQQQAQKAVQVVKAELSTPTPQVTYAPVENPVQATTELQSLAVTVTEESSNLEGAVNNIVSLISDGLDTIPGFNKIAQGVLSGVNKQKPQMQFISSVGKMVKDSGINAIAVELPVNDSVQIKDNGPEDKYMSLLESTFTKVMHYMIKNHPSGSQENKTQAQKDAEFAKFTKYAGPYIGDAALEGFTTLRNYGKTLFAQSSNTFAGADRAERAAAIKMFLGSFYDIQFAANGALSLVALDENYALGGAASIANTLSQQLKPFVQDQGKILAQYGALLDGVVNSYKAGQITDPVTATGYAIASGMTAFAFPILSESVKPMVAVALDATSASAAAVVNNSIHSAVASLPGFSAADKAGLALMPVITAASLAQGRALTALEILPMLGQNEEYYRAQSFKSIKQITDTLLTNFYNNDALATLNAKHYAGLTLDLTFSGVLEGLAKTKSDYTNIVNLWNKYKEQATAGSAVTLTAQEQAVFNNLYLNKIMTPLYENFFKAYNMSASGSATATAGKIPRSLRGGDFLGVLEVINKAKKKANIPSKVTLPVRVKPKRVKLTKKFTRAAAQARAKQAAKGAKKQPARIKKALVKRGGKALRGIEDVTQGPQGWLLLGVGGMIALWLWQNGSGEKS